MKVIAQNKKAYHDYEILDRLEVGIVLTGDEVKSIRAGHVNLTGAFATLHDGELFMINAHITPYDKAFKQDEDAAKRTRKLLLHAKELSRLVGDMSRRGVTLVPLRLYLNDRNYIKLDLGICKHKKAAGKKQELKERDIKRQTAREIKGVYKY